MRIILTLGVILAAAQQSSHSRSAFVGDAP